MKIIHIETGQHLYGGAQQVLYLLKGLEARQVKNTLIAPKGSDIAKLAAAFVDVQTVDKAGDLSVTFYRQTKKILQQEKPDLVHLHSRRGADVLGAIAAKQLNIPIVLSRRVDNKESNWLIQWKYNHYQQVIGISQAICDVLQQQGVNPNKLNCVHSSVDTDKFSTAYDKEAFKQQFSIPTNNLTIAVVAQLIKRKGHHHLLNVLPEVIKKYPHISVLFFGQGPEKDALQALIHQHGLQDTVRLMGFEPNLDNYLSAIDIIVHPAEKEGLGVALLKASAAGVPMIAGRAGGIPEIVRHTENGFLFSPGDQQSLQAHLEALISTPTLRKQMGAAGRKIARNDFSIDAMVTGNLAVYKKLIT